MFIIQQQITEAATGTFTLRYVAHRGKVSVWNRAKFQFNPIVIKFVRLTNVLINKNSKRTLEFCLLVPQVHLELLLVPQHDVLTLA